MTDIKAGFAAGFIATIVLSILMVAKAAAGLLPAFNAIADNAHLAHMILSLPAAAPTGWIVHFLIGTVLWGAIYAWLRPHLPQAGLAAGLIFGVIAWLAMMIIFMPVVGHGVFALTIGVPAAIATLVLHLIYGAALGFAYDTISRRAAA